MLSISMSKESGVKSLDSCFKCVSNLFGPGRQWRMGLEPNCVDLWVSLWIFLVYMLLLILGWLLRLYQLSRLWQSSSTHLRLLSGCTDRKCIPGWLCEKVFSIYWKTCRMDCWNCSTCRRASSKSLSLSLPSLNLGSFVQILSFIRKNLLSLTSYQY